MCFCKLLLNWVFIKIKLLEINIVIVLLYCKSGHKNWIVLKTPTQKTVEVNTKKLSKHLIF